MGKHGLPSTHTYTHRATHMRDINTLGLIKMITTEAQSTLCNNNLLTESGVKDKIPLQNSCSDI